MKWRCPSAALQCHTPQIRCPRCLVSGLIESASVYKPPRQWFCRPVERYLSFLNSRQILQGLTSQAALTQIGIARPTREIVVTKDLWYVGMSPNIPSDSTLFYRILPCFILFGFVPYYSRLRIQSRSNNHEERTDTPVRWISLRRRCCGPAPLRLSRPHFCIHRATTRSEGLFVAWGRRYFSPTDA